MISNDTKQERSLQIHFKKLKKVKLIELEENFRIQYIDNAIESVEEVDFNENQECLFSDGIDPQLLDASISFFSQAISYVTPEIFQRILSFKDCPDTTIIESVIDFLCIAVRSKNIPQDLLSDSEIVSFLLSVLNSSPNEELIKSVTFAILLFSERINDLMQFFFEQGAFIRCCEIIKQYVEQNQLRDIQLFSNCFNYINMVLDKSDTNQCDSLSEIIVPLYQLLINHSDKSKTLAKLTLNSIQFFIKQCSDQGLSSLFDENFMNFISFMQGLSSLFDESSSQDSIYVILYQYHIISFHDPSFFISILSLFTDFFQAYMNLPKKKDKMTILILEILRNLAANDDSTLLEFLLSQPILTFLQITFRDHPYSVIKRSAFVYSYLAVSASDAFIPFLWENDQDAISGLIGFLDISDPEFITDCFQCILNLLLYLEKTDQEAFVNCINIVLRADIETYINDVLSSPMDEYLTQLTEKLKETIGIDYE